MDLFSRLGGIVGVGVGRVVDPDYENISTRHRKIIEELILDICDKYNVLVKVEEDAGFSFGSLWGSTAGSPLSSGLLESGAAAGFSSRRLHYTSDNYVPVRAVWSAVSSASTRLIVWVFDFLRTIDAEDLENAANIVRASERSGLEMVAEILWFFVHRLHRNATSDRAIARENI